MRSEPGTSSRMETLLMGDVVDFDRVCASGLGEDLKALHEAIRQNHVPAAGGRMVSEADDGFLATFPDPAAAVRCGIAVQQAASAWPVPDPSREPLRVRIAAHAGELSEQDGVIGGDGVASAMQLLEVAPAGGMVISDAVRKGLGAHVGDVFTELGAGDGKAGKRRVRAHVLPAETLSGLAMAPRAVRLKDQLGGGHIPPGLADSDAAAGRLRRRRLSVMLAEIAGVIGIIVCVAAFGVFALSGGSRSSAEDGAPAPPEAGGSSGKARPARAADSTGTAAAGKQVKTDRRTVAAGTAKKPEAADEGAAKLPEWHAGLREALKVCEKEGGSFGCTEGARWKYCSPDHWNEVEECKVGR